MARKTMNHKRHRSAQKSKREKRAERSRQHPSVPRAAARRRMVEMAAEQGASAR